MDATTLAKYKALNKAERDIVSDTVDVLHRQAEITALLGVRREKVNRHIGTYGFASAARLVRNIIGCGLQEADQYVRITF